MLLHMKLEGVEISANMQIFCWNLHVHIEKNNFFFDFENPIEINSPISHENSPMRSDLEEWAF